MDLDDEDSEDVPQDAALRQALRDKTKQLKRMGILLEALAPLPGVNAERLLKVIECGTGDVRDQKIVQLARKARNLSVLLHRERAEKRPVVVQKPVEEPPAPPPKLCRSKEHQYAKLAADLRAQLERVRDEKQVLKRALAKEVGDDADTKMNDAGWRGRAQQIVMLRARVQELEGNARGVDAHAQRELHDMERDRQLAVEDLTARHAQATTQLRDAKRKIDANKARIDSLVADCTRHKDHVRVLLDKTQADNELIDALRDELNRLRAHLKTTGTGLTTKVVATTRGGADSRDDHQLTDRLRRDVARLHLVVERKNAEIDDLRRRTAARSRRDDDDESPRPPPPRG